MNTELLASPAERRKQVRLKVRPDLHISEKRYEGKVFHVVKDPVCLRYYRFTGDKGQIFDGLFGNDNNGVSLVSQPGSTEADGVAPRLMASYKVTPATNINAQVSRGFRLGGINDPLNVPLCTPQDLATFGGRDTWNDETAWNYEAGVKSRVLSGNGALNVSAFYMDIRDLQATVTAGSCSSRVVFNVPKARSQGIEMEFEAALNRNFDFAVSASFTDSELRSTLTSTGAGVRRNRWDISAFVNNVTDERALLSFDQERGTRARIGYLTNPPRTFGLATRLTF